MNRKRTLTVAGILTAGLIALGCGFGGDEPGVTGDAAAPQGNTSGGDDKAEPDTKPAQFGKQNKTLENGVVVAASVPDLFSPSDISAGHAAGRKAFKVKVTVTNGSKEPIGEFDIDVTGTMGAEGANCDRVFDQGLTEFQGSIQPGKKATATLGFSCDTKDTSVVGLQVKVGIIGQVADFEGKPTK